MNRAGEEWQEITKKNQEDYNCEELEGMRESILMLSCTVLVKKKKNT